MVSLTVDGIPVTVPRGTMILEAAEKAGIRIPTLCNDKRLLPFGACRICVVQQKGRRGLIPACFNPVRNGMEILTNTPEIMKARRTQLQLILISHPLDCPVCDKGGQCRLQDLVYEYGIAENPFEGPKTDEPVDHTTPFIERNVNRCILCGMCVRIDDEIVGANELSFLNRGDKVRIGTDFDRPMDCEFCGQCISVCPVGALNDRLFLHKARPWDLKETNTICGYCSIGCTLTIGARNGRIVRVRADEDLGANGGNLCVKGRFGWEYIQSPERLITPLIRKDGALVPASWDEALIVAARHFQEAREQGGQIAGLGSARLTNEEAYLFQKFLRGALQTNNVDHAGGFAYAGHLALRESLGYAASTASFREIKNADVIFALRADLSQTHPVVKYEIVQAVKRRKAKLIAADSLSSGLNKFAHLSLRTHPGTEAALVNGMIKVILDEGLENEAFLKTKTTGLAELKTSLFRFSPEQTEAVTGISASAIREAARLFARAEKAFILMASGAASDSRDAELANAATNLALVTGRIGQSGSGLMILGEKNNSQGALDMGLSANHLPGYADLRDRAARNHLAGLWGMPVPSEPGMSGSDMMRAAAEGSLRCLYLVGENPLVTRPESGKVKKALEKIDFLIVQDCFLTETAAMADLVLPAAVFAEKEGTFTSAERRVQRIRPAVKPPGDAKSDLWIFHALAAAMGISLESSGGLSGGRSGFGSSPCAVMEEIRAAVPFYAGITYARLDASERSAGLQWPCTSESDPGHSDLYGERSSEVRARLIPARWRQDAPAQDYPWVLVTGPVLFHSGSLSARSPGLRRICGEDRIEIHRTDAEKLACSDGQKLILESPCGKVEAPALISRRAAPGVLFMASHFGGANAVRGRDLNWTPVRITKKSEE